MHKIQFRSYFNREELAQRIISIGWKFRSYGVSNIAVSSILKRNCFNINQVIYLVNNILKRLCKLNDFLYICNDLVNTLYLWKDGLYLFKSFIVSNYLNGNVNNNI